MKVLLTTLSCEARLTWMSCRELRIALHEVSSHPGGEALLLDVAFRGPYPVGAPRLVCVGEQWAPARLFAFEIETDTPAVSARMEFIVCAEAAPSAVPLARLLHELAASVTALMEAALTRELLRHGYIAQVRGRTWADYGVLPIPGFAQLPTEAGRH